MLGQGISKGIKTAITHLDKGVHTHDGEVRLGLSIVDEVQVNQLFELQVVRLHAVDDVWKQHRDVFAHSHGSYDLLDGFFLLGPVQAAKVLLELMDLACTTSTPSPVSKSHFEAVRTSGRAARASPFFVVAKYLLSDMLRMRSDGWGFQGGQQVSDQFYKEQGYSGLACQSLYSLPTACPRIYAL